MTGAPSTIAVSGDTGLRRPLRVLHVITRMIVGGAQENTMLSCALIDPRRMPSEILCGPETGSEGELIHEARGRGVTVRIDPTMVRAIAPLTDLRALWRLHHLLRRERFDIVHLHTSKAGILGRMAAWLARTPVVIHTAHGWAFTREASPLARALDLALERLCAPMCHAIVVVGDADRRDALARSVGRPEQYRLIRSGIEIDAYSRPALTREEARRRLGVPDGAFVIGTIGRLAPQKAPLDLLEAFRPVALRHPHAHLVYVGDGEQRGELEAAIAAAGLGERVHLAGLRRDVPDLQPAFDVFALASRWEGLPRVFPQAMAAGLPIVATRVAGAPEAVTPGENGWLLELDDRAGFTARLMALADDPALARSMGARGRARVEEFSARRMVDQLAALYEELARRRIPDAFV